MDAEQLKDESPQLSCYGIAICIYNGAVANIQRAFSELLTWLDLN
jgi:hypothetical protein